MGDHNRRPRPGRHRGGRQRHTWDEPGCGTGIAILAVLAVAVFAASVMFTAAWFTSPSPASPPATGTTTGTRP